MGVFDAIVNIFIDNRKLDEQLKKSSSSIDHFLIQQQQAFATAFETAFESGQGQLTNFVNRTGLEVAGFLNDISRVVTDTFGGAVADEAFRRNFAILMDMRNQIKNQLAMFEKKAIEGIITPEEVAQARKMYASFEAIAHQLQFMGVAAKEAGLELFTLFNRDDDPAISNTLRQTINNLKNFEGVVKHNKVILEHYGMSFRDAKRKTEDFQAAGNNLIYAIGELVKKFDDSIYAIGEFRNNLAKAAEGLITKKEAIIGFIRTVVRDILKYLIEVDEKFHRLVYRVSGDALELGNIQRSIMAKTGIGTEEVQTAMEALSKAAITQSEDYEILAESVSKFTYLTGVSGDTTAQFASRVEKLWGNTKLVQDTLNQATYAMSEFGLSAEEISKGINVLTEASVTLAAIQGKAGESAEEMMAKFSAGYFAMAAAAKKAIGTAEGLEQIIKDLADPLEALNSKFFLLYATSGQMGNVLKGDMDAVSEGIVDYAMQFEKETENMSRVEKSFRAKIAFGSTQMLEQLKAIGREREKAGGWEAYREQMKQQADMNREFGEATETVSMIFKQALLPVFQFLGDILSFLLPIIKTVGAALRAIGKVFSFLSDAMRPLMPVFEFLGSAVGIALVTVLLFKLGSAAIFAAGNLIFLGTNTSRLAKVAGATMSPVKSLIGIIKDFGKNIWSVVKGIGSWVGRLFKLGSAAKTAAVGSAAASATTATSTTTMGAALKAFGGPGVWKGILALGALAIAFGILLYAVGKSGVTGEQLIGLAVSLLMFALIMKIVLSAVEKLGGASLKAIPYIFLFVVALTLLSAGIAVLGLAFGVLAEPLKILDEVDLVDLAIGLLAFTIALIPLGLVALFVSVPIFFLAGAFGALSAAIAPLAEVDFEGAIKFFDSIMNIKMGLAGAFVILSVALMLRELSASAKEFEDIDTAPFEKAILAISNFMSNVGAIGAKTLTGIGGALNAITEFIKDYTDAMSGIGIFSAFGMKVTTESIGNLIGSINTLGSGVGANIESTSASIELLIDSIIDNEDRIKDAADLLEALSSSKEKLSRSISAAETPTIKVDMGEISAQLEPIKTLNDIAIDIKSNTAAIRTLNSKIGENVDEINDKMDTDDGSLIDIRRARWL